MQDYKYIILNNQQYAKVIDYLHKEWIVDKFKKDNRHYCIVVNTEFINEIESTICPILSTGTNKLTSLNFYDPLSSEEIVKRIDYIIAYASNNSLKYTSDEMQLAYNDCIFDLSDKAKWSCQSDSVLHLWRYIELYLDKHYKL